MSDPETTMTTALRERVADEHPDYAGLTAGAVSGGLRIRRRRRAIAVVGSVAAVGAFAAGGLGLTQLLASPLAVDSPLGAAGAPSASSSASPAALVSGRKVDLGDGLTGLVVTDAEAEDMEITIQSRTELTGTGTGFTMIVTGPEPAVQDYWAAGFPISRDYVGLRMATEGRPHGLVDEVPVTVPAGWECEWYLVDDKADCTSEDGGVAGLVIRPAKDYDQWSTSPDKGGPGSGTYLTEVHGDIFISAQSGRGTTDAELEALAGSLRWVD